MAYKLKRSKSAALRADPLGRMVRAFAKAGLRKEAGFVGCG